MPRFTLTLSRHHSQEKLVNPHHKPRKPFQVAYVTLETKLDFFNWEAPEILFCVLNATPAEAVPESGLNDPCAVIRVSESYHPPQPDLVEGWEPWTLLTVSEAYEPPAPPPLVLPEGSPAAMLMQYDLARWPHHNGTDAFAPYRVLAKWFASNGTGFHWDDIGCITDYKSARDRADSLAEFLAKPPEAPHMPYEFEVRRGKPDVWPTVGLFGFSTLLGNLPSMPDRIEDSFLLALNTFLTYVISRPVWENAADDLEELLSLTTPEQKEAFWKSDEWRAVMLANGAKYRAHLEAAYEKLHNSLNGVRLRELGFTEDRLLRWDARLPPKVKLYY